MVLGVPHRGQGPRKPLDSLSAGTSVTPVAYLPRYLPTQRGQYSTGGVMHRLCLALDLYFTSLVPMVSQCRSYSPICLIFVSHGALKRILFYHLGLLVPLGFLNPVWLGFPAFIGQEVESRHIRVFYTCLAGIARPCPISVTRSHWRFPSGTASTLPRPSSFSASG